MRAQIQLGETIFAVIIILLLIVFGIVFYADAQRDQTSQQQEFLRELDAIAMSKYLTQLTEIKCSTLQVQQANCLDRYKLDGLIIYKERHPDTYAQYYFTQLQNAKLTVEQVYPPSTSVWVLYNNTLLNNTRTEVSLMPVSLLDPITEERAFGVLTLEVYLR